MREFKQQHKMMTPDQVFQKIVAKRALRALARVIIVALTPLFVLKAAISIDRQDWLWLAVCALDLGVCWWCMKRLWPAKKKENDAADGVVL